jgi:hypothetical protein
MALAGNALFVFYCTAVGVYLVLRPWSARHLGFPSSGFFRGFISGLGLLHLAAGWSDLRLLSHGLGEPPSKTG